VPRPPILIIPLPGLPEVSPGDDIAHLITKAAGQMELRIGAGDIFVVAHKIVSKSEGRIVRLDTINPSERARQWAAEYHKDPRLIELVLREAKRILKMERGVIVAETGHGFVCANAGVDGSNTAEGTAILLPEDPDRSAKLLHDQLTKTYGVPLGVIISDTFGRPWREGLVNVALGIAGVAPLIDYRGQKDASGKTLQATLIALADEIASAAELVMGKADGVPVAIVQGVQGIPTAPPTSSAKELIRPAERDIFR
jgi:coenzyme F420-0:L-glutamate ligase/coenzyme F420-1:gamma-L-glutamate ligase